MSLPHKEPLARVTVGVLWGNKKQEQLKVRDFLLKHPFLFSICTYFCLALILPQKTAFHTHSALKLLLEGKEALKGLNPRADGTRARMGQDRQDGQGKKGEVKGSGGEKTPGEGAGYRKYVNVFEKRTAVKSIIKLQSFHRGAAYFSYFSFYTHCLLFAFLLTTVNTFQEGS